MQFDTTLALQNYIENSVESVMRNELAKEGVSIVKGFLDKDLYSRPESDWYLRTEELKNSVLATYDDKFAQNSARGQKRLIIDHNTTRQWMPSGHRSIVTNKIQNKNIPFWIDSGFKGILKTPFVGINYFENSYNMLVERAPKVMISGLKRFGIEAYEI